MAYVIDRIENSIAICESLGTGDTIEVEIRVLPAGIKEGSVIVKKGNVFALDLDETNRRKSELADRLKMLFDKHKV